MNEQKTKLEILYNGEKYDVMKFIDFLKNHAKEKRETAAFGGRMDDGGYQEIVDQIDAFLSGISMTMPQAWIQYIIDYKKVNDPDYQTYLKLKEKFGDK